MSMTMTSDSAAVALAALGHPARLAVFRLLVRAAPDGLLVGEIAAHLDMPLSTLAHHLHSLKDAGLVAQTRQGREVRNSACTEELRHVLDFLLTDCCAGLPAVTDAA
jgi:DNA-binding transcriptional ArsR family regulator